MVLDNAIQRIRKLEAATGMDEEGIRQTLEWRAKIEANLLAKMQEQDWYWQDSDDKLERSIGDVAYKQILKLSQMLPVDVLMRCWAKFRLPHNLPLVWSEASPVHTSEQVSNNIKDQTDRVLVKVIKEVRKYDP